MHKGALKSWRPRFREQPVTTLCSWPFYLAIRELCNHTTFHESLCSAVIPATFFASVFTELVFQLKCPFQALTQKHHNLQNQELARIALPQAWPTRR